MSLSAPPTHDICAVFGILLLTAIGCALGSLWSKIVVPSLFFGGDEVELRLRCEELRRQIVATSSSDLVRKGQLEREEISLQKKLAELVQKRQKYTFSLLFFAFSLHLKPSKPSSKQEREFSQRTLLGRLVWQVFHDARIANVADDLGFFVIYNLPLLLGYVIQFLPTAVFLFYRGVSRTPVTMLPFGSLSSLFFVGEYKEGEMFYCTGWVWWALCIVAVRFMVRVFLF